MPTLPLGEFSLCSLALAILCEGIINITRNLQGAKMPQYLTFALQSVLILAIVPVASLFIVAYLIVRTEPLKEISCPVGMRGKVKRIREEKPAKNLRTFSVLLEDGGIVEFTDKDFVLKDVAERVRIGNAFLRIRNGWALLSN